VQQSWTAVVKQDAGWWIGWIEELPGVNAQERSRDELLASLRITLGEALDFNRAETRSAVGTGCKGMRDGRMHRPLFRLN
jgi:predicted RNase H-like HicB family nuclease